ncbi:site-2 protease family protein [Candidatus Woesebacteria bacterium]|nr:site-2 protease family protein [Candidatus Woesebacteria bacterium]
MVLSIITALIILSILVLVHEFGHFIIARKTGVLVEEFGLGLPPRLWSKKIGETLYSINALPFGGFVKLHGENEGDKVLEPKRAFVNKGKLARASIIVMSVVMNVILGVVAFAVVYSISGIPKDTKDVKVVNVLTDSPAQIAGISVGDVVRKVDNRDVSTVEEFIKDVEEKKGKRINLEIERQQNSIKIAITPRANPPEGEGPLGVVITTTDIYFPPIWQRPFVGAYYGIKEAMFWGQTVVGGLVKTVTQVIGGHVPSDIGGPVAIVAVASQASKMGILTVINFMGILSINLAILNILPLPALDGGRLLFIGIESILRRKVTPKIESMVHSVGMVISKWNLQKVN